jgi:hypothetical protein
LDDEAVIVSVQQVKRNHDHVWIVDDDQAEGKVRFQFVLKVGFVPSAGQLIAKTRFGMGFYEQTVLIDRMLQEDKQRAASEMKMIDHVDQFYLIDRLCSLESLEQVNMLKKSWGSDLVFLAAILIGSNIHANAFPVSINLFESVILYYYV